MLNQLLTKKECEWAPEQFKHSRYFPYQDNNQETTNDFYSYHWPNLIMLVHNTECPINHKSEQSVHRTDVV